MSSFGKNIIPRRAHKERAQPAARVRKHGLLEKKGDYKLRARDRNRKKLRVKLLREKAAFRNPDEFYHAMARSATDAGRHRRRVNAREHGAVPIANRTREQRLLAETQDARYVGVKHALEGGRLRALNKRLHFVAAAERASRKHVLYVDDEDEMEHVETDRNARENARDSSDGHRDDPQQRRLRAALQKEHASAYRQLQQRVERRGKLKTVLQDMNTEKMLLSKGRRFKVPPSDSHSDAPTVYKWQQERRR